MITIPINVHHPRFLWHLDLFWFSHRRVYGARAANKAFSAVVNQHTANDPTYPHLGIDIPHHLCNPYHKAIPGFGDIKVTDPGIYAPINIQISLEQIIDKFNDAEIIELVDHDMLHFRRHPDIEISHDVFYVCDLYEKWHLKSMSTNKEIISMYFENGGKYYNGGFVPIVGTARTFKKILYEWKAIHMDILSRSYDRLIHWWAGMFAFNAACEKKRVQLVAKDTCYIPNINKLNSNHYIAHYSVDPIFNKKSYPSIDVAKFPDNDYYNLVKSWPSITKKVPINW